MSITAFDFETCRFRPGLMAPPMAWAVAQTVYTNQVKWED
jgi:hypothetical protein